MRKQKKVPLILQVEKGEGGAAALAMILQYWGKTVALEQLVLDCGAVGRLTNARDLILTATRYGLYAAGYRVSLDQLKRSNFPLIAHWNNTHFVVITARKKRGYLIHDPWDGTHLVPFEKANQAFSGVVLCMRPSERFLPDVQEYSFQTVLQTMAQYSKPAAGSVVLCSILILILHLMNSVYLKLVANGFSANAMGSIGFITGIIAIQAMVQLFLYKLQRGICHSIYQKVSLKFSRRQDRSNIPMEYLALRSADYIENLLQQEEDALCTAAETLIPQLLFVGGSLLYLVLMLGFSLPLTLLFLGLLVVWATIRKRFSETHTKGAVTAQMGSAAMQLLQEPELDPSKLQHRWTARFHRWMNQNTKCRNMSHIDWIVCAGIVTVLFIGSLLLMQVNLLTFPNWISFGYLEVLVLYSMVQGFRLSPQAKQLDAVIRRAGALFPRATQMRSQDAKVSGLLEWKNVGYRPFEGGEYVFQHVSFQLRNGITAVIGDTHHLFAAFCTKQKKITEGIIYYGDTSLQKLTLEALDDTVIAVDGKIAYQEITIASYLRRRATKISDTAYINLNRELGVHSLIMDGGGYQAPVSELSDCGKLLLSLANAILAQPQLLILDDILRYLDEIQEQAVLLALKKRKIDCIVLTKPSAIPANVDRVMELQKDCLDFHGTLDEFMAKVGAE